MSAYGTMLEEARADRHYERLVEDAANAAETQAWTWHRKRHGSHHRWQFGWTWNRDGKCAVYEAVRYALVQGVAGMTVEQQLDYLVNGRTRKRL